jgi:hypothetical protein
MHLVDGFSAGFTISFWANGPKLRFSPTLSLTEAWEDHEKTGRRDLDRQRATLVGLRVSSGDKRGRKRIPRTPLPFGCEGNASIRYASGSAEPDGHGIVAIWTLPRDFVR